MNQLKKAESANMYKAKTNVNLSTSLLNLNDTFPIEYDEFNVTTTFPQVDNTVTFDHTPFEEFWLTHLVDNTLLKIYCVLVLIVVTLTIGRSLAFYRFCNKASIRLHNNMFYKIVYATMRFFNTNQSGRILNRFSKDMNQVDEVLPFTLLDTLQVSVTEH